MEMGNEAERGAEGAGETAAPTARQEARLRSLRQARVGDGLGSHLLQMGREVGVAFGCGML